MRPSDGAKPVEVASMRRALEDGKAWCGLGLVVKRAGSGSHFEVVTHDDGSTDVQVEIDLMPDGEPVTARLAGGAGGAGTGIWRVPPPGTEVAWVAMKGEIEADHLIVATLATGAVPDGLDGDTLVLCNPKNVLIKSQQGDVKVDASGKIVLGGAAGPTQSAALGDNLDTRLSSLESAFAAHVHPFVYAAGPAVGTAGTTTPTATTLPPPPNVKSAKVALS